MAQQGLVQQSFRRDKSAATGLQVFGQHGGQLVRGGQAEKLGGKERGELKLLTEAPLQMCSTSISTQEAGAGPGDDSCGSEAGPPIKPYN